MGKAMFVCASRGIAFDFYDILLELRPEWGELLPCDPEYNLSEQEIKKLKPIEKVKIVMTRDKDDGAERYEMLGSSENKKKSWIVNLR